MKLSRSLHLGTNRSCAFSQGAKSTYSQPAVGCVHSCLKFLNTPVNWFCTDVWVESVNKQPTTLQLNKRVLSCRTHSVSFNRPTLKPKGTRTRSIQTGLAVRQPANKRRVYPDNSHLPAFPPLPPPPTFPYPLGHQQPTSYPTYIQLPTQPSKATPPPPPLSFPYNTNPAPRPPIPTFPSNLGTHHLRGFNLFTPNLT